jgi:hypothetical protein
MHWQGELLNIHVAPKAPAPMVALSEVRLVAGIGLEGDRYGTRLGIYSKKRHIRRQATLIEIEVLQALARDRDVELASHEHRRNLTTRGDRSTISWAILSYRQLRIVRRAAQRAVPLS